MYSLRLQQCTLQFSHEDDRRGAEYSLEEWLAMQFPPGASAGSDFVPGVQTAQDDVSSGPKRAQWRTDLGIVLARLVGVHLKEHVG